MKDVTNQISNKFSNFSFRANGNWFGPREVRFSRGRSEPQPNLLCRPNITDTILSIQTVDMS